MIEKPYQYITSAKHEVIPSSAFKMEEAFSGDLRAPIADLSPALHSFSTKWFQAVVTLIWPYSSSTGTLTVLLAEPDFRLRRAKGQVRVKLTGSSAKSVAEAGIGSGDELKLSLLGAEFVQDDTAAHGRTPGKGIDWELAYTERLYVQVGRA